MKKIFELKATRKHYYYVMNHGYYMNSKLNHGTITLIGVKTSEEKYNNGFSTVYNYKYLCRDCGWDFMSRNTYGRAGYKPIQCPNCGHNHLPEGTVIVNSEDKVVPVYYRMDLYAGKEKIVLEMKSRSGLTESNRWEATEKICFDTVNKNVEWHLDNNIISRSYAERIGYLDDSFKESSGFSCLGMESEDDNGHSVQELCEVLSQAVTTRMHQLHKAKAKSLIVKCPDKRKAFFDTLLKIAHYTRFCDAPDTRFYGLDKSIEEWYKVNNINYQVYNGYEQKLEEIMYTSKLSYARASLRLFDIPEVAFQENRFSYKNIGLYVMLQKRYVNRETAVLLFGYASKLSSRKSSSYSASSSLQMIFLNCMDILFKRYPQLPINMLKKVVSSSFIFIKYIKQTEDYKAYLANGGKDRERYITNRFEDKLAEEMFTKEIEKTAALEKKNFYQVLSSQLEIPNTSALRKYYVFGLIKMYQRIYKKYNNLQEANELVAMAHRVYSETYYRKLDAVENYLGFYDAFKEYYPDTITPAYACNYTLNDKNNPVDCVNMLQSLDEASLERFKAEKPRLKKLHDYLSFLSNMQMNPEILYDIPESVQRRTEMYLKNTKLSVLTKYSQLFKVGSYMHNCAATYRNKINANHYLVLATDDKGLPKALLEIKDEAIIQAKLMSNKPVHADLDIQKIVVEFAAKCSYRLETTDIQNVEEAEYEAVG